MKLKDKLEIGLKPGAPYRPENLPETQQSDEDCLAGARPDDADWTERARARCDDGPEVGHTRPVKLVKKGRRHRL